MKESLIAICVIIFCFIFSVNLLGFLFGFNHKCNSTDRIIKNNWITGGGFKLSCDRSK